VDLRGDRHVCHYNQDNLPFEHNFYGINCKNESENKKLCLILNSTLTWLFIEVYGRVSLGSGAIRLVKNDLINLPIISPNNIDIEFKNFENILKRDILSVFEELGINPKIEIRKQEPQPKKDRYLLDKIIFDKIGLTEEERKEVYWAVCELVKQRIEKAKSLNG